MGLFPMNVGGGGTLPKTVTLEGTYTVPGNQKLDYLSLSPLSGKMTFCIWASNQYWCATDQNGTQWLNSADFRSVNPSIFIDSNGKFASTGTMSSNPSTVWIYSIT